MPKIDTLQPGQIKPQTGEKVTNAPSAKASFKDVLDKATQQPENTIKVQETSQAFDPLNMYNGIKKSNKEEPLTTEQTLGLVHAERTIDLLDNYQAILADHTKPLKEVHRVLAAMDNEVKELTGVLEKLEETDEIYGLLQEVAVSAMVETIKFNRGDYLPHDA